MTSLPKALLLGDSIRMSYQPIVAELLAGRVDIVGSSDNCQYSLYTLSSLDRWSNELGKPDIVHWNNGLHDAGHNPYRAPVQIPIDIYRNNLEFILIRLKQMTSLITWATITPVHPNRPFRDEEWSWHNEEIEQYNKVAIELMMDNDIEINDLHSIVASDPDRYLCDDQLHLSETGKAKCAEAVSKAITSMLVKLTT